VSLRTAGNGDARTPKIVRHVGELARAHCAEAIAVVSKIMTNAKSPPAARVAAAKAALGRATIAPKRCRMHP
jgi:hypothetical protein